MIRDIDLSILVAERTLEDHRLMNLGEPVEPSVLRRHGSQLDDASAKIVAIGDHGHCRLGTDDQAEVIAVRMRYRIAPDRCRRAG